MKTFPLQSFFCAHALNLQPGGKKLEIEQRAAGNRATVRWFYLTCWSFCFLYLRGSFSAALEHVEKGPFCQLWRHFWRPPAWTTREWFTPLFSTTSDWRLKPQCACSTFNTSAVISHTIQNVTFKEWCILLWTCFNASGSTATAIKISILLLSTLPT